MKKIEFDYLLKKFTIETDEPDSSDFVKEYTVMFLDKILKTFARNNDQSNVSVLDVKEDAQLQQPTLATAHSAPSEEIIDLFGITEKRLAYILDFNNDSIKIIVRNKYIKGSKAEMQVKLALLYCGACEYKNVKANTKDIRNVCNTYQCLDGNFAPNIKKTNYFNITNAVNADVVLTMPGKDKLVEIVQEILMAMENN